MTEAEKRVWQILSSHQIKGYKFSSPQEAERSGFLQNQGYRILRFWNNEVLANLDSILQTIADELGRITPTQTLFLEPSPSRGRVGWG